MLQIHRRLRESPLHIAVQIRNNTAILALQGRLDIPLDRDLLRAVEHLVEVGGYVRLIVECSGLEYLSSRGVSAFIAVVDDLRARSGDLKLVGARPQAKLVLERLGVTKLIQRFTTLEEAFRAFETPIGEFLASSGLDTFVSTLRTSVFHASACASARRLRDPVVYASKREARRAGKRPCLRCCAGDWQSIAEE